MYRTENEKIGTFRTVLPLSIYTHAMNMMRVNDGTKSIVGDHFVTNLREDRAVQSEMLNAEKREFNKIINKNQSEQGDD